MNKMHFLLFIVLFPFVCFSQTNPQKFRNRGWQTFAYRITAAEAEQFVNWDSIPVSRFVKKAPFIIFPDGHVDEDTLPLGNYVLLSADDIYIRARFLCISNLVVLDINNKQKLQMDIRSKAGESITDANVFINNNEAVYNKVSKTFWVKQQKLDDAFVNTN